MLIRLLNIKPGFFDENDPLLSEISARRRENLLKIKNIEVKRQSFISALLVRMTVSDYSGAEAGSLRFDVSENGKPYCLNKGCEFNMSHTSGLIVCAVSGAAVGIDAEKVRRLPEKVLDRFTSAEKKYIMSGSEGRDERFFRVWTRKEAYGKMTGRGILGDTLTTDILTGDTARLMRTFRYNDHIVSVCGSDIKSVCMTEISEDELRLYYSHE